MEFSRPLFFSLSLWSTRLLLFLSFSATVSNTQLDWIPTRVLGIYWSDFCLFLLKNTFNRTGPVWWVGTSGNGISAPAPRRSRQKSKERETERERIFCWYIKVGPMQRRRVSRWPTLGPDRVCVWGRTCKVERAGSIQLPLSSSLFSIQTNSVGTLCGDGGGGSVTTQALFHQYTGSCWKGRRRRCWNLRRPTSSIARLVQDRDIRYPKGSSAQRFFWQALLYAPMSISMSPQFPMRLTTRVFHVMMMMRSDRILDAQNCWFGAFYAIGYHFRSVLKL